MPLQMMCDYCGELIESARYNVKLSVIGIVEGVGDPGRRDPDGFVSHDPIGTYHASDDQPCWAEMLERLRTIHDIGDHAGRSSSDREQRRAQYDHWRDERRRRDEEHAARRYRIGAALEAWEALGDQGQQQQFLGVFDSDDWLLGREVAARLNSQWTLEPGEEALTAQTLRGFARRMVAAGLLEEAREHGDEGRFMYRRADDELGRAA